MGKDNQNKTSGESRSFLAVEAEKTRRRRDEYRYERLERGIRKRIRLDGARSPAFEAQVWADGKAAVRTFTTISEARAWRDQHLGARAAGERIVRADPKLRVARFIETQWIPWLAEEVSMENLRASTGFWYQHGSKTVIGEIGRVRVGDTNRNVIRGALARRIEAGDSKAKLHQLKSTLRSIYSLAVERDYLTSDPTVFLVGRNAPKATRQDRPKVKAWSKEDAQRFLESVAGDPLEALWVLYLSTGLRRGEALGLEREDIDLKGRSLTVRRSLSMVGNEALLQEPKTASSRRTVAFGENLEHHLVQYRLAQTAKQLASDSWTASAVSYFTNDEGQHLRPEYVTRRLKRLVKSTDLEWIGVHGLRHTMASLAIQNGTDIATVSQRLGHSNTQITAQVYLHGSAETDRQAAAQLDDMFAQQSPG